MKVYVLICHTDNTYTIGVYSSLQAAKFEENICVSSTGNSKSDYVIEEHYVYD